MRKSVCALLASMAIGFTGGIYAADTDSLIRQLSENSGSARESADQKLREIGWEAVAPLRAFKSDNSDHMERVRKVMSEIAINKAKITVENANLIKTLAREEGEGRRYLNAEILYRRAEQMYDILKDDAHERHDLIRGREYAELQHVCDKMKDKARNKYRGTGMTGLNLGFMRFGVNRDMSDRWE